MNAPTTVEVQIVGAAGQLDLLACDVLLRKLRGARTNTDAAVPQLQPGFAAIEALLEEALRSRAPCAGSFALSVILGGVAWAETARLAEGATSTIETMKTHACPRCLAALEGRTAPAEGAVH